MKRWKLVRVEASDRPLTRTGAWLRLAGLCVLALVFGIVLGLVVFGLLF